MTYHDDDLDPFELFLQVMVIVFGIFIAIIIFVAIFGPDPYEDRIEKKYGINVIEIQGKYGDGNVIYTNNEGLTCTAIQKQNDVLVELSCAKTKTPNS